MHERVGYVTKEGQKTTRGGFIGKSSRHRLPNKDPFAKEVHRIVLMYDNGTLHTFKELWLSYS